MRLLLLTLLAVPLLLAGCDSVESVHPLSSPRSALPDPRLEGMWRAPATSGTSGNTYLYIAFHSRAAGTIFTISNDKTDGLQTFKYDFFVTHTPRHDYMNFSNLVVTPDKNGELSSQLLQPGRYSFAEYHFNWLGQLRISQVEGAAFSDAVKNGKLRGETQYAIVNKKETPVGVLLTDSPAHILSFIESSKPKDVFSTPPAPFNRIGGP